MRRWAKLTLCALLAAGAGRGQENLASRVIVVANAEDAGSLRIARHYAEARGVPPENIVTLKLPLTEEIGWREFVAVLWEPLLERLVADRWIDAIPMTLTDAAGRRKYAPNRHRMAAIVLCRGVPLKIAHDPALFHETPPFTRRGEFRTNAGAVDSELALLPSPNYPINAFVPNPFFSNERSAEAERQAVRVTRLDGPTVEDAIALVDRALAAEKTGLLGRAYVDVGDYDKTGNEWLESAARQLEELGFDVAVDRAGATMPATARCDAPALYFGWYSGNLDGPFALPGFRFPAGAVALHIHSYSAGNLRSTTNGWTAPFIARGVTATVGNVYEPYLQFTHRPNLLLRALARGATWAEAAYYSINALSWQGIAVGDPLYRPFAVPLEEQLKRRNELPPLLAGYATLRRMRELEAASREEEAKTLGVRSQRETPNLAVGVWLAERLRSGGEMEAAANALGFVALMNARALRPDEWALAAEAAKMLSECGRPSRAVDVWRMLLGIDAVPRELRLIWLKDAESAARAAGEVELQRRWAGEAAELAEAGKK